MTLLLPAFTGAPEVNRVYQVDALSLLRAMPDSSVDLVFIDPPYGNNNGVDDLAAARAKDKVKGGRQRGAITAIANDDTVSWEILMPPVIREINRVLKPNGGCCCCCCGGGGPNVMFAKVANWLDQYQTFFHAVIWDKSARGFGMGWRYRRNYEFVMVSHKKGGSLRWQEGRAAQPNVVNFRPTKNELHPTEKPISLVEWFIENHTEKGDLVVDCFAGSGTTLRAAANLERKWIGGDMSFDYVTASRVRMKYEFTPNMFITREPATEVA